VSRDHRLIAGLRPARTVLGAIALAGVLAAPPAAGDRSQSYSITEAYQRAPEKLDADVSATGVVVLDFTVGPERGEPDRVHGAVIRGVVAGSREIYGARLVVAKRPVVLFAGVPPGRYRVTHVLDDESRPGLDWMVRPNQPVPTPPMLSGMKTEIHKWALPDSVLEFEVREGELTYVGPFQVTLHKRTTSVESSRDPERELAIWRAIGKKYSPSPWDAILARRVAQLAGSAADADAGAGRDSSQAVASPTAVRTEETPAADRPAENPESSAILKAFDHIVATEKLGSFARRAGPTGEGARLEVTRDSLRYLHRKSAFALAARQLRAVSRENHWIAIDFELDGAVRRRWLGFGLYNDFEITDQLEYSLTGLLRRGTR
jgi:hypothetical protein